MIQEPKSIGMFPCPETFYFRQDLDCTVTEASIAKCIQSEKRQKPNSSRIGKGNSTSSLHDAIRSHKCNVLDLISGKLVDDGLKLRGKTYFNQILLILINIKNILFPLFDNRRFGIIKMQLAPSFHTKLTEIITHLPTQCVIK